MANLDYTKRSPWLLAFLIGAANGAISIASLMIGIGVVKQNVQYMVMVGVVGLIVGACSMAMIEFVSVYWGMKKIDVDVPIPLVALASFLAFSFGASLPLLAAWFIINYKVRVAVVVAVVTGSLVVYGWLGAIVGKSAVVYSTVRVLFGGWLTMGITFGLTKLMDKMIGL